MTAFVQSWFVGECETKRRKASQGRDDERHYAAPLLSAFAMQQIMLSITQSRLTLADP